MTPKTTIVQLQFASEMGRKIVAQDLFTDEETSIHINKTGEMLGEWRERVHRSLPDKPNNPLCLIFEGDPGFIQRELRIVFPNLGAQK